MRIEEAITTHTASALRRQAKLQEYLARRTQEQQLEHQHRLELLNLRITLMQTPKQAGFLRARGEASGPFETFYAELRRDKKIYFFAHTAESHTMPIFSLELSRVEDVSIVEVDGRTVGRPLTRKTPLLQFVYSESSAGAMQVRRRSSSDLPTSPHISHLRSPFRRSLH